MKECEAQHPTKHSETKMKQIIIFRLSLALSPFDLRKNKHLKQYKVGSKAIVLDFWVML